MAKHLSPDNREDQRYMENMFRSFIRALREEDRKEAEDCMNELSGVACAMFDRVFPPEED